jgi:signal transduction histidine kinase
LININATDTTRDLILNKHLSIDNTNYTYLKHNDLHKKLFTSVFIKLGLNKEKLKNNTIYLKVICDVKSIDKTNIEYEKYDDYVIFKLDNLSPQEIIINLKFQKANLLKISFAKFSEFEYKYILKKEGLFYGIAYGIIFCAFLYNFVIYLFYRQKLFLYYSLMQFFAILVLYYSVLTSNQTYISDSLQMIRDLFETICLLSLFLFSQEILNTKEKLKKINIIIDLLIYLSLLDILLIFIFKYSLLYEYLPRTFILGYLIISGFISFYKGNKIALLYCLSWTILFICLLLDEHDLIGINILYLFHIGIPLESFILSFALGYKLKISLDEKVEKEKMLIQQSKMASMGEMLNNIAHQWRQPLTNLSFINADLKMAVKDKNISDSYLNEIVYDSSYQIDFMSETLENLKGFYQPNKKKESFLISDAVQNVINIIKPILESEGIHLEFNIKEDKKYLSFKNEYSQVVLNLLTNAKDALLEENINNPFIEITLDINEKEQSILTINDNAKGIPEKIIDKVFDPYFSTKNTNSGIGLYMSKVIVESHLNGNISVSNTPLGACFIIKM